MRVEEAYSVVAATPRICSAYAIGYAVLAFQIGHAEIWAKAWLPAAGLILVMALLLRRWYFLHNRPRPERVSARLVWNIVGSSVVFGISWGAFVWLLLPGRLPEDQVILTVFAFVAAVNTISISFWTAITFSTISLVIVWGAVIVTGTMGWASATGLFWLAIVIVVQGILNRRALTVSNIVLAVKNRRALADVTAANEATRAVNASLTRVSAQLRKYISPELYGQIVDGSQDVRVASERKRLTVFFSDVVSFTEITDRLEPEELTDILNTYLGEMAAIAREHGACFDKFMGDGMLFYFGDPVSHGAAEDAGACVRMAIAMQRRMRELNAGWLRAGLERPLELRIGVHSGFCTVGNFGNDERMDYTIIGSSVNLASRLEYHCEPGSIMISHATHALVQDWLASEECPPIKVRGFVRPVRTHKVMGIYDGMEPGERVHRYTATGLSVAVTVDTDRIETIDVDAAAAEIAAARKMLDSAEAVLGKGAERDGPSAPQATIGTDPSVMPARAETSS